MSGKVVDALRRLEWHEKSTALMEAVRSAQPGDDIWLDVTENMPTGLEIPNVCVRDILHAVMRRAIGIVSEGEKK